MLSKSLEELDIKIGIEKINKFESYMNLLLEWNKKINLTAITEKEGIVTKHFADSLTCLKYINKGDKIIDIGTGAGFPGIPIKIINEKLNKVILLDSLNKRINFLNEVIKELNLEEIYTIHGRAEDIGNDFKHREKYDVVISRAVANLAVLAEYCLPFVKKGGVMISMKGGEITEEAKKAEKAINFLGGEIASIEKIKLPFTDIIHSIIKIKKANKTPAGYPRKAGKPEKDPIN